MTRPSAPSASGPTTRWQPRPEVRRAAGLVATALALALACTVLGLWQWHRHEDRSAAITVVKSNYAAAPVPLAQVLAPGQALSDDDVWRPVRVTGRYQPDRTVLLRNRPVDGRPAYHVLVPLVLTEPGGAGDTRTVLVVDRGWLPTDVSPDDAPPPEGEVDVVVRLRADEPGSSRDAPAGQVQAIAVRQVLEAAALEPGTATFGAYGALVEETPAAARPLGSLPRPSTDPGSHLSYALQWWTFALGSLVGFTILARRELVAPADGDAPDDRDGAPGRLRRRRGPSAEDVEDALIDAQLR